MNITTNSGGRMSFNPARKEWLAARERLRGWGNERGSHLDKLTEVAMGCPCPLEHAPEPFLKGRDTLVRVGKTITHWLVDVHAAALTPDEAEAMAAALIEHARYVRGQNAVSTRHSADTAISFTYVSPPQWLANSWLATRKEKATPMSIKLTHEEWLAARERLRQNVKVMGGVAIGPLTEAILGPCPPEDTPEPYENDDVESSREIPYPPVFRDWRTGSDGRVATGSGPGGVEVQMMLQPSGEGTGSVWKTVELTEDDACLLAASLLQCAGRNNLSRRVLNGGTT